MLELCVLANLTGAGAYKCSRLLFHFVRENRVSLILEEQLCQLLAKEWALNPALNTG